MPCSRSASRARSMSVAVGETLVEPPPALDGVGVEAVDEAAGGIERGACAPVLGGVRGTGRELAGRQLDGGFFGEEGVPGFLRPEWEGEGVAGGPVVDAAVAAGNIEQLLFPAFDALAEERADLRRLGRGLAAAEAEIDDGFAGHGVRL